jgi:hypothetical protein
MLRELNLWAVLAAASDRSMAIGPSANHESSRRILALKIFALC